MYRIDLSLEELQQIIEKLESIAWDYAQSTDVNLRQEAQALTELIDKLTYIRDHEH